MYIGRVEGSVVASVKDKRLAGLKLLVVRLVENNVEKGRVIAGDATRQAGVGDLVYMIGSKEASLAFDSKPACDVSIVGFIDDYNKIL